ncbi:forkhead box protein R1 [Scyliorhinus torazame]|uniref:forkhead box protein R1 n=1 Tax=Scyliorhinus torazame TaxID=75743 RepID=UPI003B5B3275
MPGPIRAGFEDSRALAARPLSLRGVARYPPAPWGDQLGHPCGSCGVFTDYEVTGREEFLVRWQRARLARGGSQSLVPNSPGNQAVDESNVRPHMWLMVNPRLACTIKYPEQKPERILLHTPPIKDSPVGQDLFSSPIGCELSEEESCRLPASGMRISNPTGTQNGSHIPNKWLQPAVSYFILIALVIRSSLTHSLTVQEIYSFICEHFPYFLTAPKGWKNRIRRNLCFNRNFKMVTVKGSGAGQQLWSLTSEGKVRLREDLKILSKQALSQIQSSMMTPESLLHSSPD